MLDRNLNLTLNLNTSKIERDKTVYFYNTDKNIFNIYVKFKRDGNILTKEEVEKLGIRLFVVKNKKDYGYKDATLLEDEEEGIVGFKLEPIFTNKVGRIACQLEIKEGEDKELKSDPFPFYVRADLATGLNDEILHDADYPILVKLIDDVKELQAKEVGRDEKETAREAAEQQRKLDEIDREKAEQQREKEHDASIQEVNEKIEEVDNKKDELLRDYDNFKAEIQQDQQTFKENYEEQYQTDINNFNESTEEFKSTVSKNIEEQNKNIEKQDNKIDSAIETQNTDIENKANALEAKVNDKLAANKEELQQQITAQGQEIQNNITPQLQAQDEKLKAQDEQIENIKAYNEDQDTEIKDIKEHNELQDYCIEAHDTQIEAIKDHDDEQDNKINAQGEQIEGIKSQNELQEEKLKDQGEQIEGIKEHNELQDYYIKGLYNENEDGRIEITTNDNMKQLPFSTKGFVDIQEIQGNTLVNVSKTKDEVTLSHEYSFVGNEGKLQDSVADETVRLDTITGHTLVNRVIDGEEIVLNDKIDVTGTNEVVLENTVGGGKVDVVVEGNTLVNILKRNTSAWGKNLYSANNNLYNNVYKKYNMDTMNANMIIPNKTYTLIINVMPKYATGKVILLTDGAGNFSGYFVNNKFVFTTSNFDNSTPISSFTPHLDYDKTVEDNKELPSDDTTFMLLEGDYTDKPTPEYFEGMKSVGELEGNNIEIISKNEDETKIDTTNLQLQEPLRGLPNGVKDKIVHKNGKWYIERNCTTAKNTVLKIYALDDNYPDVIGFYFLFRDLNIKGGKNFVNNILPVVESRFPGVINRNTEGVSEDGGYIKGTILKSKLTTVDLNGLKKYFEDNNAEFVCQLAHPTYEEITSPQLLTYLDKTYVSVNSTIPANLSVSNSGIELQGIAPNSTYTLTKDVEGTSSNAVTVDLAGKEQVAADQITTGDTINNYMKLYGKGITYKNIMLLDGTESNYGEYFTGMRSSFDEVDENGKYPVEVKVHGKNLFDGKSAINGFEINEEGVISYNKTGDSRAWNYNNSQHFIDLEKGTYTISCIRIAPVTGSNSVNALGRIFSKSNNFVSKVIDNVFFAGNTSEIWTTTFTLDKKDTLGILMKLYNGLFKIQIEEGTEATPYEPYWEENTKTVYLNSPLLQGDELVSKEDGVYHVHNSIVDNDNLCILPNDNITMEKVSDEPLNLISNTNAFLQHDTTIPTTNTTTKAYIEELSYLQDNTKYVICFEADIAGQVIINLGGTAKEVQVVEGYNKVEITTPSTTTNVLKVDGRGINISKVVVSTQEPNSYFEGTKNVEINKIISKNADNTQSCEKDLNIELTIHDRLIKKDDGCYIERNYDTEPTEEKLDIDLLLECYENGFLVNDSIIKATIKALYSCSLPSIYKTNKDVNQLAQCSSEQDLMALETAYRLSMLEILTGFNEEED